MIRVVITLESAVSQSRNRLLGAIVIANDGSGVAATGNYDVALQRGGKGHVRHTRVENFPRARRSVFELVRRALNQLEEAKNLP